MIQHERAVKFDFHTMACGNPDSKPLRTQYELGLKEGREADGVHRQAAPQGMALKTVDLSDALSGLRRLGRVGRGVRGGVEVGGVSGDAVSASCHAFSRVRRHFTQNHG